MSPAGLTLFDALAAVPDHRNARGRSYSLPSMLCAASAAILCGARSLYAIQRWGEKANDLAPLFGFAKRRLRGRAGHRVPCMSEWHVLFSKLDSSRFEATLADWVRSTGLDDIEARAGRLDRDRLAGFHGHQIPGVPILSVYADEHPSAVARLRAGHLDAPVVLGLLRPDADGRKPATDPASDSAEMLSMRSAIE